MEGPAPAAMQEYPNYQLDRKSWHNFFQFYVETQLTAKGVERKEEKRKYAELISAARDGKVKLIQVNLDDVMKFEGGAALVTAAESNTKRHIELAYAAIDDIIKETYTDGEEPFSKVVADSDRHYLYMAHRVVQLKKALREMEAAGMRPPETDLMDMFPPSMRRMYELRFVPRTVALDKAVALRDVKGEHLGKLVAVKAIVLRASDVKASIQVVSYTCDVCGFEMLDPIGTGSKTFMPVSQCQSSQCKSNQTPGRVSMQTRASCFTKFQEIKVQELPEQVPVGHIPRTMTVYARGEVTRSVTAGDVIKLGGVFMPTPYTGFQAIRAGLTADTYLEAQYIVKTKKALQNDIDDEAREAISALHLRGRAYEELAASIAPEIYGHEDVKRALLLQLVGGVSSTQKDGMKTRGDINICLMGDPGVAKSQLLKHIARSAPRAVYTTGKGSSGVGLTAAVMRDPMTNELALEGGALVLADMGICCIDEFDKMEETDRTAIHEVMEQQTVSIAKAGITTTLNARTAILAAANPKYGRYNAMADRDPHSAMQKNINLPPALLSRFDLMFLLLDKVDSEMDKALAEHITYVHMHEKNPDIDPAAGTLYSPHFIRQYVSVAKHINTHIPRNLTDVIAESYVQIRETDKKRSDSQHNKSTTTARQLLSILRLAEARARLFLREEVDRTDIDEAIRLILQSKASVVEPSDNLGGLKETYLEKILDLMSEMVKDADAGFVVVAEFKQRVQTAGFTQQQVDSFLHEYEDLAVLQYNASRTMVSFTH